MAIIAGLSDKNCNNLLMGEFACNEKLSYNYKSCFLMLAMALSRDLVPDQCGEPGPLQSHRNSFSLNIGFSKPSHCHSKLHFMVSTASGDRAVCHGTRQPADYTALRLSMISLRWSRVVLRTSDLDHLDRE